MSIKECLKRAYENVAFNADETWITDSLVFQRANQELFSKECHLQLITTIELRPRTVKDCIPMSKLAQYSCYEYNEARELSYAPNSSSFNTLIYYSREFQNHSSKEPWLLPEVDDLFILFTSYRHFGSQILSNTLGKASFFTCDYESPMLKADSFDKRILKMQICSDKIRNIWTYTDVLADEILVVKEKMFDIYKSPTILFCLLYDDRTKKEEYNEDFVAKIKQDFDHLKHLSKSFKERNCWIWKNMIVCQSHFTDLSENIDPDDTGLSAPPSKRLYSAVLQGLSGNMKPLHTTYSDMNCDLTLTSNAAESYMNELSPRYGFHSYPNMKDYCQRLEKAKLPSTFKEISSDFKNPDTSSAFTYSSCSGNLPNNIQPPLMYTAVSTSFPNSLNIVSPQYINAHNYQLNSSFRNNYQSNYIYSSTFTTNFSQIIVNRGVQSLANPNYVSSSPMILMQQNRTSAMFPLSHHYVQQSLYPTNISCPRPIHRWLQSDYPRPAGLSPQTYSGTITTNFFPPPSTRWIGKTNHPIDNSSQSLEAHICKIRNKIRRSVSSLLSFQQTKVKKDSVGSGNIDLTITDKSKSINYTSQCIGKLLTVNKLHSKSSTSDNSPEHELDKMKEVPNQSSNDLLVNSSKNFYVPVTPSLSEELEIQAIEQYCSSGDVYQELERQAEEQYEQHSENWISPPSNNPKLLFGGLGFNVIKHR